MAPDPDDDPRRDDDGEESPEDRSGPEADGESGQAEDSPTDAPEEETPDPADGGGDGPTDEEATAAPTGEEDDDDDGIEDWDLGPNVPYNDDDEDTDPPTEDDHPDVEIPATLDFQNGYERYEERFGFDDPSSERTSLSRLTGETEGDSEGTDGHFEVDIPSTLDFENGYEGYEERFGFDGDSSERMSHSAIPAEEAEQDESRSPIERKTATGPQSDEEQPLAVHIEEMVKRLGVVIAIAGVVSLAAFPFAENVVTFLWYSILPGSVSQPHVYHPLELVLTQLKTASLAGLVIALPAFVYETYAFMRPGLYPHERRYYLAAVPTSLILAVVGVSFAYFIVLPAIMNYFLYYSESVVDIAFALGQTFNLILILMGYLALVFQIPLFIMLAIMMGLTTRQWMEDRRLIFWGVFLGISFLFSPDPTGMAPLMIAATMIGLFEGTLLLLRWTNRGG